MTTPLKYLSLVFAIIFGFYLFNEIPTIYTLTGAGLIVISSAIIFTLGFAGVSILIRKLTLAGEPVYLIAFYFSVCSAIFGLFTLPFGGWLIPTIYDLGLLILIGVLGSIANLLLTKSYQLAEVSLTTPLKYLSLVFAIIFGFYLFNEVPTIYTLSGAGLIVVSSAIIFVREHQLKKPITLPRQQ